MSAHSSTKAQGPDRAFWDQRFREGNMPWDRGAANPQLEAWLAAGVLKPCRILVPGCGAGHEVAALARAGFDVTALDYSPEAIARTRENLYRAGLVAAVVEGDALDWLPVRPFEAIYEQTCLCALYPDRWRAYGDQLYRWLKPGGKLFALFVQYLRPGASEGSISGPPYHCDIHAMRALLPEPLWAWPRPPYPRTAHPRGLEELAVVLERRNVHDR
ncbi:MAG: methyltransferase domain-containing protein [Betaproteobacteria bacterium]|nr:methyltransferase domain-containing protein [Betaproteobacteria bacterium]